MPEFPIVIIGVSGDTLPKEAARAVAAADLIAGGRENLDAFAPLAPRRLVIDSGIQNLLNTIAAEPGRICVLASGDPGFFGIVRALAARFGPSSLEVHPAPSSVSLAFARLGLPWDDAVVVSAHGRPLSEAVERAMAAPKVAVLTAPETPPEALGRALVSAGAAHQRAAVCSNLGTSEEQVDLVDLAALARGRWPGRSVVVLLDGNPVGTQPALAWGLDDHRFAHRRGMITKSEVRAVALGKLDLPPSGVLWDVGAGSGSVAIECARLCPALRVVAVERSAEAAGLIRANAGSLGVRLDVVEGDAPAALRHLPAPDRAFVGGGGLGVLDCVIARMRPGGRVVATFAAIDRAAAATARLGNVVQVAVSRGRPLPDGAVRLEAENPVFVVWGDRS